MDDGSGSETPLPGCVEVWTYDGTTGPTTTLASAALITGPAELGAIRIQVQEYLQVGEDEAPGDDEKYDIILGQGAMWKLGVWVDETGRLCKKKRRFRK